MTEALLYHNGGEQDVEVYRAAKEVLEGRLRNCMSVLGPKPGFSTGCRDVSDLGGFLLELRYFKESGTALDVVDKVKRST